MCEYAAAADARSRHDGSYSAWLTKVKGDGAKARWLSGSSKRYFTIDFRQQMFYYSHAEDKKTISQPIRFKDILGAEQLPRPAQATKFSSEHTYGFAVRTCERTFELFTDSYLDAQHWVDGLNAARDIANGVAPQKPGQQGQQPPAERELSRSSMSTTVDGSPGYGASPGGFGPTSGPPFAAGVPPPYSGGAVGPGPGGLGFSPTPAARPQAVGPAAPGPGRYTGPPVGAPQPAAPLPGLEPLPLLPAPQNEDPFAALEALEQLAGPPPDVDQFAPQQFGASKSELLSHARLLVTNPEAAKKSTDPRWRSGLTPADLGLAAGGGAAEPLPPLPLPPLPAAQPLPLPPPQPQLQLQPQPQPDLSAQLGFEPSPASGLQPLPTFGHEGLTPLPPPPPPPPGASPLPAPQQQAYAPLQPALAPQPQAAQGLGLPPPPAPLPQSPQALPQQQQQQQHGEDSDWDNDDPAAARGQGGPYSAAGPYGQPPPPPQQQPQQIITSDWDSEDDVPPPAPAGGPLPGGGQDFGASPLPPPPPPPPPAAPVVYDPCGAPPPPAETFVAAKTPTGASPGGGVDDLDELVGEMLAANIDTSIVGHGLVPGFHCTGCDFQVLRADEFVWAPDVEYMWFRNTYPSIEKLRKKLVRQQGCSAYCCQCSWKSAHSTAALHDVAEGLRWRLVGA